MLGKSQLRCVNLSPIPRRSSFFTCPSSCDRLQVCGVTHTPIRGQLSKGPAAPSPTCPEFCSFDRGHGEADGLIEVKQKRKMRYFKGRRNIDIPSACTALPSRGVTETTLSTTPRRRKKERHSSTWSRKSLRTGETHLLNHFEF